MSDILLAKPNLDSSWIDTSVGESHVVRDALLSIFDIFACDLPKDKSIFEYQQPQGYKPLVHLLENKYQAPVVITNGAKNALGAAFYALKQMGKNNVYLPRPFWALIPPLMDMHELKYSHDKGNIDSYLCVAPGNPDGYMPSPDTISFLKHDRSIPTIHDAVYFHHIYLPKSYQLQQFGDVQIYSASKSYGLSSIRVGWAVCPNEEFYKHILHYMEAMTVGVSVVSQIFLYDLLNRMIGYPTLTQKFEALAFDALQENKRLVKQIDPEILQVPDNMEDIPGMFLWARLGPRANFQQAKVNIISGTHFGMPGYIRMNLALPKDQIKEIIHRLNSI